MDIKTKIKFLLKEADLYRSQGLLSEAKGIYEDTLKLIRTRLSPRDGEKILQAIMVKITSLENDLVRVEKKVLSPSMTKESQDLIKKMFVLEDGGGKGQAAFEAAKALMKFGQFERAKEEFANLIEIDQFRSDALKHILNCYFLESKYDEALAQYETWSSDPLITKPEIEAIGIFIQSTFTAKGMHDKLPDKNKTEPISAIEAATFEKISASRKPGVPPGSGMKIKPSRRPEFEEEDDEFEEFDVLESIKKSKKLKKE
jgi:hypothetical protein